MLGFIRPWGRITQVLKLSGDTFRREGARLAFPAEYGELQQRRQVLHDRIASLRARIKSCKPTKGHKKRRQSCKGQLAAAWNKLRGMDDENAELVARFEVRASWSLCGMTCHVRRQTYAFVMVRCMQAQFDKYDRRHAFVFLESTPEVSNYTPAHETGACVRGPAPETAAAAP